MALLVRSWNVFHGNASPPDRRSHLAAMIELATADRPDVLCLQELPLWALRRLADWSGMRPFAAVARRGAWPIALAGWITRLHNGWLRSAISGQANAILVGRGHVTDDLGRAPVSVRGIERRVAQAVRIDGRLVVANTHLTTVREAPGAQLEELNRVRAFAESHTRPGDAIVLAGDFNLVDARLDGYSAPGPGIDHVLVRGAPAGGPLVVWPEVRRRRHGALLSDHAPVELSVG